jgi:hypothetical protein
MNNTVNALNPKIDQTVRVFDNFYKFDVDVPVNEYDAVYSYFKSVITTPPAAANFAITLFRIADLSKIPVMTLLEQLQGQNKNQLTATLCYYLNNFRSPATLLGITSTVTPNFFAARNIRL